MHAKNDKDSLSIWLVASSLATLLPLTIFFCLCLPSTAFAEDFQLRYFDLTHGRLAFSYINQATKDIMVLDFDDLSVKPLVNTSGIDEGPAWSPDGQTLVFHSDLHGNKEIYSVDADGANLTRLTTAKGADENPSFSPDGKHIVFQSSRRGPGSEIFIMNADGTNQRPLTTGKLQAKPVRAVTPRFSPTYKDIFFTTDFLWPGFDIAISDFKGTATLTLTDGSDSYLRPTPRPDSLALAFSYGRGINLDIWLIKKGETTPQIVVSRDGRELDPCWTQDGNILFFVGEKTPGAEDFQLFAYDFKQDKIIPVFNSEGSIRQPAWTPLPSLSSIIARISDKT